MSNVCCNKTLLMAAHVMEKDKLLWPEALFVAINVGNIS